MKPFFHIESARERLRGAKREARRRVSREIENRSINMLVKADYVLAPLEAVLTQMELRDTVDVDATGTPVFRNPFGSLWYATAPAIAGIVEFVDQWGIRNGKRVVLAPLRQMQARLKYAMPVDQALLDEVKVLLLAMPKLVGLMTPDEARSLLLGSMVKAEMEEVEP